MKPTDRRERDQIRDGFNAFKAKHGIASKPLRGAPARLAKALLNRQVKGGR